MARAMRDFGHHTCPFMTGTDTQPLHVAKPRSERRNLQSMQAPSGEPVPLFLPDHHACSGHPADACLPCTAARQNGRCSAFMVPGNAPLSSSLPAAHCVIALSKAHQVIPERRHPAGNGCIRIAGSRKMQEACIP